MHADLLFPSKYLKAIELRGKDVTLTIYKLQAKEKLVMVGGKTDIKPLLFFEEARESAAEKGEEEKRMVLNPTNKNTIKKLYGTETNDWVGKRITLFPEPCEQSPTGWAIRVRPVVPPAKHQQQAEPVHERVNNPESLNTNPAPAPENIDGDGVVTDRQTYDLRPWTRCSQCGGGYAGQHPVNARTGKCDGCDLQDDTANDAAMSAIASGAADMFRVEEG